MLSPNKINFEELLVNLLSELSEREQEILKHRYQLTSDLSKKATLKQIGDNYQITRERVRQIEKDAIKKLALMISDAKYSEQINLLGNDLVNFLERQGGLVHEDRLLQNYVKNNYNVSFLHLNAFLFVFDNLINDITRVDKNESFHTVWTINKFNIDNIANLLISLENKLTQLNELQDQGQIIQIAKDSLTAEIKADIENYLTKHTDLNLDNILESYLYASKNIKNNILDQWGLANWDNITPKKLGDKILLVFQKHAEPLHFREIAEKINQSNFDHKNICPATVHNELIANDKYVLIGRGIYALKDWGYATGTVAEIIAEILKKSDNPMTKDEIYQEVLKQRKVNKSTIYLTLINKDQFVKGDENKFFLNN